MDIFSSYTSTSIGGKSPATTTNSMISANSNNYSPPSTPKSELSTPPLTPQKVYISMEEVKKHNKANDLWMVLFDKVYDLTEFLDEHPGGSILLEGAGKDATYIFEDIGHSYFAVKILDKYYLGDLDSKK